MTATRAIAKDIAQMLWAHELAQGDRQRVQVVRSSDLEIASHE
jgi:hypothetical protein